MPRPSCFLPCRFTVVQIGSGFDVCSAAFGSIGFARIPPTVLGQLMDAAQKSACAAADADVYSAFGKTLISLSSSDSAEDGSVAKQWNYEASPFVLPDGLVLMLADVVGQCSHRSAGPIALATAWCLQGYNTRRTTCDTLLLLINRQFQPCLP